MATITIDEYRALAAEPMTQERYETLCARYGVEATNQIAAYMQGDYDYDTYGQRPEFRLRQLRARERMREREAAQSAVDEAAQRERQRRAMAAYEQAERERAELDSGY